MDMIERYLAAVAAQLSQEEREDIVAELRDLILSRFEAKEEELGRTLTDDEREAILREIGHPLVVAARYRKGPDSLVGPELFPYWLFAAKAGLLLLLAVQAVVLFINLISGPEDAGRSIAQAFHGFFGAGLTLIGALTVAAAIFEHYGVRPRWLTQWRVKDLGAFGLADPAAWGAAMGATSASTGAAPRARPPLWRGRSAKPWPGAEYVFSFLAVGAFVLWWVGVLHFPGLMSFQIRGGYAQVHGAPIWAALHGPILLYALGQMAVDLASLAAPHARRMRAAAQVVIGGVGLWLTWVIFEAGHWFTLTSGGESARVEGGWSLLRLEQLSGLDAAGRDLAGLATVFSIAMTWMLAVSAISLAFKMLANLGRLARG